MTSQSSGGSGSGLPGVTGDGMTPGGEKIAGALTAGDPTATSVPSYIQLYGSVIVTEAPGNQPDGDATLIVLQNQPLVGDSDTPGISIVRSGALSGHQYQASALHVEDTTATTGPAFDVQKGGGTQFQVDSDGVQIHGKLKTGASVTHTASVLSGKCVPIYDEAGTLLGYMPLYN